MEKQAYQQYLQEADNWLHNGRRALLGHMARAVAGGETARHILEVGAGSGKSMRVLDGLGVVDVVETEPTAIQILKNTRGIRHIYTQGIPFALEGRYDIIVAMDVIEHIENDQQAFDWMYGQLQPGGVMILTVPAFQWMFSHHDVALNHCRRYTLTQLHALNHQKMHRLFASYFNFTLFPLAVLTRLKSKNSGKKGRGEKQNSDVPGLIDRLFLFLLRAEARMIRAGIRFPWGLTAVVVYRKQQ